MFVRYNDITKNKCSEQSFATGGNFMNNTNTYLTTKRELLQYKRRLNHHKIIRRRVAFGILSIFLVLLFFLSFSNMTSEANEQLPETTYKYFTYHTIIKGDSLWNMAEEHIDYAFYSSINDYIAEVKEINHLTDDTVIVGETIVLPYFSTSFQ